MFNGTRYIDNDKMMIYNQFIKQRVSKILSIDLQDDYIDEDEEKLLLQQLTSKQ